MLDNNTNEAQLPGHINRTLSEAIMTSMAECFAVQQGVVNTPSYDRKNMPVRDFIQDITSEESSAPANCENSTQSSFTPIKKCDPSSIHGETFEIINYLFN